MTLGAPRNHASSIKFSLLRVSDAAAQQESIFELPVMELPLNQHVTGLEHLVVAVAFPGSQLILPTHSVTLPPTSVTSIDDTPLGGAAAATGTPSRLTTLTTT